MVFTSTKKQELIVLRNAGKLRGDKWIFRHVDVSVIQRECVGLLGPNGSGKSTILRALVGFEKLEEGEVFFTYKPISFSEAELPPLRRNIGFVAQGLHLWPYKTALENVMEGLRFTLGKPIREAAVEATYWLERLQVGGHARKYPGELSGGEKQRVAIARALALRPALLILDEPTTGLDPLTSGEIAELLLGLREQDGLTLLIVSHQIDFLRRIADKAYFLQNGGIRETGIAKEMLACPQTPELTDFISRIRLGW
jgi:ABC-type polar amino acid transport system ATPase subunit